MNRILLAIVTTSISVLYTSFVSKNCKLNKLPSIKVGLTILAWCKSLTLTFNPLPAMVMTYSHEKVWGQRSVGSKDREYTNRYQMYVWAEAIGLHVPPILVSNNELCKFNTISYILFSCKLCVAESEMYRQMPRFWWLRQDSSCDCRCAVVHVSVEDLHHCSWCLTHAYA